MKTKKKYFVTGISTEVGKTIASAIVTEALEADYWKPIQAGDLHNSDTDKVEKLITNPELREEMGQAGFEYAQNAFNANNMCIMTCS